MDEAEKYKQRLEAIAEKRRQQDEQDRVRRELEDEKLRLQQLKRKSLRDQWLMEGAPLSPTSLDAQSPRSPLWGSQAQEIEKHIDKLQSESQRLAEEKEKEQMGDGQVESVNVAEAAELVQDVVVQNGENNATASETTEDEVKINKNPPLDETPLVLTNGGGDSEADTSHKASEQSIQSTTNGPIDTTEDDVGVKLEPESSLGDSEAEPGQVPDVSVNEEDEGTLVIRAECVIITDEGDDASEDLTPREDQQETVQPEENPLPNQDAGEEGEEAVQEVVKTEEAPETLTQPETIEATEPTAEEQLATGEGDVEGDVKTNENEDGDGETKAEGQDKQLEDPSSVQLQSPATALEGTTVASLPVYSEAQPSTLTPKAEGEAAVSPEGAEAAIKVQDPAPIPGQFQEVPLADPQENQRTEAGAGEQEPLLSQAKAPNTQAEPAAANSATNTETHSPTRASQGEEAEAPKRKTCQCCSVM